MSEFRLYVWNKDVLRDWSSGYGNRHERQQCRRCNLVTRLS